MGGEGCIVQVAPEASFTMTLRRRPAREDRTVRAEPWPCLVPGGCWFESGWPDFRIFRFGQSHFDMARSRRVSTSQDHPG
jgi:hypothetical protein